MNNFRDFDCYFVLAVCAESVDVKREKTSVEMKLQSGAGLTAVMAGLLKVRISK